MRLQELIIAIVLSVIVYGGLLLVQQYRCDAMWGKSGMETSWGPIQGCLVQSDGRWIPSENFREMP